MKGLLCSVLQDRDGTNCSNGGISSKVNQVILVGNEVTGIFEPRQDCPAVILQKRGDYCYCIPVEGKSDKGTGWMFGGQFVYTSDSRFPIDYPLPLHDRQEFDSHYSD